MNRAATIAGPRAVLPRFVVAGAGLLACLVLFEILARIEGTVTCIEDTSALLTADPEVGWTFTPGLTIQVTSCAPAAAGRRWRSSVSFNDHGLADQAWSYTKRPGEVRVLLLGDERVDGLGLARADRLSFRLSHLADQVRGARVSGINAAIPGYGPAESLRWLERRGLRYAPDLVVLLLDPAATAEPAPPPVDLAIAPAVLPPSFGPIGPTFVARWIASLAPPGRTREVAPQPAQRSPVDPGRADLLALVSRLAERSRTAGAGFAVVVAPACPPDAGAPQLCEAISSIAPCTDLQPAFAELSQTRAGLAELCLPGARRWGRDAHFLASHQLWTLLEHASLWPPTVRRGHRL